MTKGCHCLNSDSLPVYIKLGQLCGTIRQDGLLAGYFGFNSSLRQYFRQYQANLL